MAPLVGLMVTASLVAIVGWLVGVPIVVAITQRVLA
jgi:hypothetical protein